MLNKVEYFSSMSHPKCVKLGRQPERYNKLMGWSFTSEDTSLNPDAKIREN